MANERQTLTRCKWCGNDPLYVKYHDEEWGKVVEKDEVLFEFLILESAQAGLSWITILKRRENYRKAFANFNAKEVAAFKPQDVERLMQDEGIIRNKRKIETSISNAQLFLEIQKEQGSFKEYLYSFLPDKKPIINSISDETALPSRTELSDAIAKDLKKRGFKFFGTTICYAFMQAVGMVNDHVNSCSFK